MNVISLTLLNFPKITEEKRSIIALLITGFISLAYDGRSSYLHNKKQNPYTKHS